MIIKRYHRDVYFPDWTYGAIVDFCFLLRQNKKIRLSYHAKTKYKRLSSKQKRIVMSFIKSEEFLNLASLLNIFEFYATDKKVVKKICYTFPSPELNTDVIIVVSSTGKIVTIYINNNHGGYKDMNKDLYEKEPIND